MPGSACMLISSNQGFHCPLIEPFETAEHIVKVLIKLSDYTASFSGLDIYYWDR